MMENIKIKQMVTYNGHSLSANGNVSFNLKAKYSELGNTINLMQLLNNDITVRAKVLGGKPMKLGMFKLRQIVIDGDGESVIKLIGLNDYIEMDNLNGLPLHDSEVKEFAIMYDGDIELEDDGEEENDEE